MAHLVRKMIDCARCLGQKEVDEAMKQYQVVAKLCGSKPLFNDCFGAIPMSAIQSAHGKFKREGLEATKVAAECESLVNLITKMTTVDDLIMLT